MSSKKFIHGDHVLDDAGNPAGGKTTGAGVLIHWQNGPLVNANGDRIPPSGAFVEGVIEAAIDRIEFYNTTKFRCRENEVAIDHLNEALAHLGARTRDREERGIEGTHAIRGTVDDQPVVAEQVSDV